MMGKDGLAVAIPMTLRIASFEPGLNARYRMPQAAILAMMSEATSRLGTPAPMVIASIG